MSFENLFNNWKHTHNINAFIKDGIVDPESYEKPHVLFILRDMNCTQERNLCEDLDRDGSGWKTWNNIGRWAKALLDGDEDYPWDMSTQNRVAQLKRIAVMNLKKEGGVSRTDGSELLEAVRSQNSMIYQEISLCDPSIIICCGLPLKGCPGNADLLWQYVFPLRTEWKYSNLRISLVNGGTIMQKQTERMSRSSVFAIPKQPIYVDVAAIINCSSHYIKTCFIYGVSFLMVIFKETES